MTKLWLSLLTTCLIAVAASPAWAGDTAAAEIQFQKGREAMDAENYEEACERFAESHRLDPAAGTVMNLATCEEKVGRLASAWEHWQQALRLLEEDDRRREFAQSRVTELEGQLPRLSITPGKGAPENIIIERDGTQLGRASWGEALPVDPGRHEIVARTPNHAARKYSIEVGLSETKELEVLPGEKLPDPPPSQAEQARNFQRIGAYIAGGVGVAGFALAGVTAALLPDAKQEVENLCGTGDKECPSQEGLNAASRGQTLLGLNTAGFIIGGVGIAAGVTLFLTAPSPDEDPKRDDKAKDAPADTARLRIDDGYVDFRDGGATVTIRGTF